MSEYSHLQTFPTTSLSIPVADEEIVRETLGKIYKGTKIEWTRFYTMYTKNNTTIIWRGEN